MIQSIYTITSVIKFDGDSLNIFFIINEAFGQRAEEIFNPRNNLYISRNDGKFNKAVCAQRDTLINLNTFIWLGREKYNQVQMNKINAIRARQKELYGF